MMTIADETRTARKAHRCELCRRDIEPGEKYRHQRYKDCGDIWTWRQCAHCDAVIDALIADGMCGDFGIDCDLVGEWEPDTIAGLRLKVGWKRKWRRRDGSLYPLTAKANGVTS
jgi:predicted RNA-binding Zn-ribbon protein involved in translation (DUF1610 family)